MTTYSAVDTLHQEYGYEYQEIEGMLLPLSYTTGTAQEIEIMQTTAGILDLKAFNLLSMKGPEAASFLQGMVSNDIQQIEVGQKQSNLLSHPKGKILYHLEILRVAEEEYLVLTNAGEGAYVGGYLDHFHIREDLEIQLLTPDYLRCDLIGPLSENALNELGYSQEMNWNFQTQSIISGRFPLGRILRFVNIIPQTVFSGFIKRLLETPHHLALVGFEAFDHLRIDAGIPWAGVDYTQDNFPQEAALMDHISYSKGCYIGQETHARMYHRGHPNWQSVALAVPTDLKLQVGQELFYGQEKIGTITSLSRIETEGKRHGIGFIKYRWVQASVAFAIKAGADEVIQQFPLSTFHSTNEV